MYANYLFEWSIRLEDIFKLSERGNVLLNKLEIIMHIQLYSMHVIISAVISSIEG